MKPTFSSPALARLLPPRPGTFAAVVAVLCLPLAFGQPARDVLQYDRAAIAAGEVWRLATGQLVHHDPVHLGMNVAGLALLWWLFVADARPREWAVVALASVSTVAAGLWFLSPGIGWYVGASGWLHGTWAAAGVAARRRWPLEGAVTLALLAAKLVLERLHGPLSGALDASLPVVTAAHLYGAVGGATAAAALRLWRKPL
jgi:rhomboid family GlyGly-CTERM serine protease